MMDWAHIHIMINHFPVILAVIGALAAVLASLRGRRGAWLYATASLTLAAITVLPTYFTGEPAQKALNRPWYVARGAIHTHEQSALIAAILVGLAGLVALVAWRRLVRYPREITLPGGLRAAVLLTSIAAAASIGYTSLLGGRIVHDAPVLSGPAPAGYVLPSSGVPAAATTTTGAPAGALPPVVRPDSAATSVPAASVPSTNAPSAGAATPSAPTPGTPPRP
jgi:uncharacterized membrane protein